ncbi:hypothetical protein ALCH109712_14005 [Alkalicoccus chagannorensis]
MSKSISSEPCSVNSPAGGRTPDTGQILSCGAVTLLKRRMFTQGGAGSLGKDVYMFITKKGRALQAKEYPLSCRVRLQAASSYIQVVDFHSTFLNLPGKYQEGEASTSTSTAVSTSRSRCVPTFRSNSPVHVIKFRRRSSDGPNIVSIGASS